jgi:hypothetical protein
MQHPNPTLKLHIALRSREAEKAPYRKERFAIVNKSYQEYTLKLRSILAMK